MQHRLAGVQRKVGRTEGLARFLYLQAGILPWLCLGLLCSAAASAQPLSGGAGIDQIRRPGQTELPPPVFEEPGPQPGLVLPPVQPERPADRPGPQLRVHVKKFVFEGNTVFSDVELSKLVAPYEGRVISADELLEVRDLVTRHYIEQGYVNSGALIPDQEVIDGVITLEIVEGELTSLDIYGTTRLRPDYVGDRVRLGAGAPLNVNSLQERLQILQENPLIERINAALAPGARPGESELNVDVVESRPYQLRFIADNRRPPSVGAEQGTVAAEHLNLTGRGDLLRGSFSITDGLKDYFVNYQLPVTARDTRVGIYYEQTDADVVEDPFDDLDIESNAKTFGLQFRHPLYRKPGEEFTVGALFERKRSRTYLLDQRFSFAPGVDDGKSDVSVLRLTQDWIQRHRDHVVAARSVFSFGLDVFGATDNDSKPDGEFFHWLGQVQLAQRLPGSNTEFILRADAQLTQDPLLPMEKFVVGGMDTVRGYRENQLVRDNGIVASLEFRIPVLTEYTGDVRLRLAPFFDYGRSWNDGVTPKHKNIASAGGGLLVDYKRLDARLYLAKSFDDINRDNIDKDLQDDGVHFSVSYSVF